MNDMKFINSFEETLIVKSHRHHEKVPAVIILRVISTLFASTSTTNRKQVVECNSTGATEEAICTTHEEIGSKEVQGCRRTNGFGSLVKKDGTYTSNLYFLNLLLGDNRITTPSTIDQVRLICKILRKGKQELLNGKILYCRASSQNFPCSLNAHVAACIDDALLNKCRVI